MFRNYELLHNVLTDEALKIPIKVNNISSPSLDKVLLTVISESGEKRESFIKLLPKSGYAFIQTDKPIYTPKESVRIRMIRLDEQLKPLNEKIKLRIKVSIILVLFKIMNFYFPSKEFPKNNSRRNNFHAE
jgi:hypothetical protein